MIFTFTKPCFLVFLSFLQQTGSEVGHWRMCGEGRQGGSHLCIIKLEGEANMGPQKTHCVPQHGYLGCGGGLLGVACALQQSKGDQNIVELPF